MRCKKHPADYSSAVGVCATCLRERLLAIIEAQSRAQAREEFDPTHQKPDKNPPPLLFPRSVSPYISHRKSDTSSAAFNHHRFQIRSYHSLPDPKFFSTPQIGPTGTMNVDQKKKKSSKFGLFSRIFRSKSDKYVADSDPKAMESQVTGTTAAASPAWFPNFLSRKKQTRTFSVHEVAIRRLNKDHRPRDRGMSPAMDSDDETEAEPSGYTSDDWRQTPKRTPASLGRRGGGRSTQLSRNVSGISFCLSPMVRASPSQSWNHKGGVPPEMVVSGEIRMPIKSHSITASLCKNRSRKLADIGRSTHNR